MARHDCFHPGIYLFVVLALSLSMVSISDGQSNTLFKFNQWTIEFTQDRLERFLRCLCMAKTSTCQQDYILQRGVDYTAQGHVRSENISASEEVSNTFRCHPGALTETMSFINCVRSSDPPVDCQNGLNCQEYFVNLNDEGCDSKCINIWWVVREVEITNVAGHPAFVEGSCEPSNNSSSSGNNNVTNDGNNNAGDSDENDGAGNNDENNDTDNNDSNNDAGNNDGNNDAGNNDGNNDTDSTGLMVAAAAGWLFFGLLAGFILAFLYCWKFRKAFDIHKKNQSEQKETKFVDSQNRSLPNTYGEDQPYSPHGRGNVNKINGHCNGYIDYNETNDVYTVIDDEQAPGVKKVNAKSNGAKLANKKVLPHSPYFTLEPDKISEGNSQTAKNSFLPTMITDGNVSQRNKLSTEAANGKTNGVKPANKKVLSQSLYFILEPDEISEGYSQTAKLSTEAADAYSRLQTGRSAADPQMTKSDLLTYNRPSDTLNNNDEGGIDPERPGRAEDAVNRSVDPYNLASAVYDERDERASRH